MAKKWFAAGCGQTLSNVQSAKRLAQTLPFQTQVFSNASLPPDLKLELSTVLLSAVFRSHALLSAVFVFYFIVRSFRAERNICIALDLLDVLQDTNVIGRSFRLSAVTVTGDEGNADAPGSSGDRKAMQMPLVRAAADGREIPRLLLYVYLTYCPCYINKSKVSRRATRKYSSKCRKLARQTPGVVQSQGVVSSERALAEQRDPLRANAQRLDLRDLKLFVAAQSTSHRAPFPGLGSHASHLFIRDFVVWRKPRTGISASLV